MSIEIGCPHGIFFEARKKPEKLTLPMKKGVALTAFWQAAQAAFRQGGAMATTARRFCRRQLWQTVTGLTLGLALFLILGRCVEPRYDFSLALDARIPFLPWSWFVYLLFFPFVAIAAAYAPEAAFFDFKRAAVIAVLLAAPIFVLLPEHLPRPDVALIDNAFLRQRLSGLWRLDRPTNGLPSLHVALTLLACRMHRRERFHKLIFALGGLICLSTLTLKQHTLIDLAGGLLLAGFAAALVGWRKTHDENVR